MLEKNCSVRITSKQLMRELEKLSEDDETDEIEISHF